MSVEVIDPGDYGGDDPFAPAQSHGGGGGGLPFEQPRTSEPYEPRYEDIPEVKPSTEQRMSGLDIGDTRRRSSSVKRASSKPRRPSAGQRDNYVYWRLEKEGEDWGAAYRRRIPGTQKEIEKLARKGSNSVLAESRRMGPLRAQHLDRLISDANYGEKGDAKWEAVYIDSVKVGRKTGKIECKSMDVILGRTLPQIKPANKSKVGELVDILKESKPKDKGDKDKGDKGDKKEKKDKDKDKDKDSKKDDLNMDDPFDTAPLFHKTGKPMDGQGPLEFKNGGLPDYIPADRPIGAGARDADEKKDKKDKKDKKRSKSRGSNHDGIIDVLALAEDSAAIPSLEDILGTDDGPIAEAGRRPRERQRSKSARRRGQSWGRADDITVPPRYRRAYSHHRGGAAEEGDTSSDSSSEQSHYGIGADLSSRTSNDTYGSIGRRGSHYDDVGRPRVYKEHHRGPSHHRNQGGGNSRRYSRGNAYYASSEPDRMRQIEYREYAARDRDRDHDRGELVRARVVSRDDYDRPRYTSTRQEHRRSDRRDSNAPILHYPDEIRGTRAERYMNESVIDEEMDRREYEIRARERRMDIEEQEEELRRRDMMEEDRLREYGGGGRRYHDDYEDGSRRYSRGFSEHRYDGRRERGGRDYYD